MTLSSAVSKGTRFEYRNSLVDRNNEGCNIKILKAIQIYIHKNTWAYVTGAVSTEGIIFVSKGPKARYYQFSFHNEQHEAGVITGCR
jgi:hypothetical protein